MNVGFQNSPHISGSGRPHGCRCCQSRRTFPCRRTQRRTSPWPSDPAPTSWSTQATNATKPWESFVGKKVCWKIPMKTMVDNVGAQWYVSRYIFIYTHVFWYLDAWPVCVCAYISRYMQHKHTCIYVCMHIFMHRHFLTKSEKKNSKFWHTNRRLHQAWA